MKWLWLALISLLTIYAPLELANLIVVNELILRSHPHTPSWQFLLEIALFWLFYLAGMFLVSRRLKC